MGVLRFATDRPLSTLVVFEDVRRAAEYRAGYRLSDDEVRRQLDAEWNALVEHWVAVGQWILRLEDADTVGEVPRLRPLGCPTYPRSKVIRQRQSDGIKAAWAQRKLSGATRNNPPAERRAEQAAIQRAVWARRRADGPLKREA